MSDEKDDKSYVYKIINKETGKFLYSKFTKGGKVWTSKDFVAKHLDNAQHGGAGKYIPNNWEIVEFELVETKRLKPEEINSKVLTEDQWKIGKIIK